MFFGYSTQDKSKDKISILSPSNFFYPGNTFGAFIHHFYLKLEFPKTVILNSRFSNV